MNMTHIQTFVTISDCGNFSETAKRLFVPQPTVSNRIHYLENTLGCELFVRGRKGVTLTPSGERFLPYARKILEIYDEAIGEMGGASKSKEVVIGSTVPFTFPLIFEKIQELCSHNPDTNLHLISIYFFDIVPSLRSKQIDLAFVIKPIQQADVETHQIGSEQLRLIVSSDHPLLPRLAAADRLETADEFIVYYQPYSDMFHSHPLLNLPHKRKLVTNHTGLIKQLIKRSSAVSFLPESIVRPEIERGELIGLPIRDAAQRLSIPYFLMYRKNERYYEDILLAD